MSDIMQDEPHTVYVKFGPKAHQEITVEVASMVLTLWRERAPATFGAYLGEVLTGERAKTLRKDTT